MKTGPQRYPGASATYWYQTKYGGDSMESNVIVWHSTEGTSLPTYDGGSMAPNFTAVPDFKSQRLVWYQHFEFDVSSRALVHAGAVATNTLNVCQVEIVGTCDPASHTRWSQAGVAHLYMADLPGWVIRDLAAFARWAHDQHGVPLTSGLAFKAYPASYGTSNGVRMTNAQWLSFEGHCGHMHVPSGNVHGDPGQFPMVSILATAESGSTQEDDVALTADDINKIADAVFKKIAAGDGVLEAADLQRIWSADVVPAARPPYNNPDYYQADGKTPNNTTWTAGYTQQTQTEGIREAVARVKELQAQVGAVDLTDAQISALASAVAANPALAEQIAEKVAVKLAERLAE